MEPKVITDVATEPLTLAEVRTHLRVTPYGTPTPAHPDDALITQKISDARQFAEEYLQRSICDRTLEIALDAFPAGEIELPWAPVKAITSIKYLDETGALITLSSANYFLDDYGSNHTIQLAYNCTWPATRAVANAVQIRYTVGYAVLPPVIRSALLLLIGHLYENRQDATPLKIESIPMGAKALLDTKRKWAV